MNDSWKIFNLTYIDQNNILIDGSNIQKNNNETLVISKTSIFNIINFLYILQRSCN